MNKGMIVGNAFAC